MTPRPSVAPPPGPALPGGADSSVRLVGHLAYVGFLSVLEDRLFFYCASEMARIGNVRLEQVFTDHAHNVAEMRGVCYLVLSQEGNISWATIAARFNKSRDTVRFGAQRIADALRRPADFAPLIELHRQLAKSFQNYLTSLSDAKS